MTEPSTSSASSTPVRGPRVIGAGMGRTGTASLKRALETLGFGPCHHMEEVVKNPAEVPTWEAAARGEKVDWAVFMNKWGSAVDFPAALYYRDLMAIYPDAKIILSLRDPKSWYQSMGETIHPALTRFPNSLIGPYLPYVSGPTRVTRNTWLRKEMLDRFAERDHVIKMFTDWNEEAKRVVPADRLLVFEAKDGWEPLCKFLGVPVPSEPYPRVNDSAEFKKRVNAATVVCWAILLAPFALAASVAAWLF
jgi:hypothetical protein